MPTNAAAWLPAPRTPLEVGPAEYTAPGADEIVVKNSAVAINPLDWILQLVGNVIYPWVKYPFVVGTDVAGEVVEVGSAVTRFAIGDRVLALATGSDPDTKSAARGAFQQYTVVLERMASPIPDSLPFADAAVLPLALSTAACALFQKDHLALQYPSANPTPTGQTVLITGGSTSVGSNAIQLAVAAGYEVVTTASPRSADYVRSLGATTVVDYASPTVVADLVEALRGKTLAGAFAVAVGSAAICSDVLRASEGRRFISIASAPTAWQDAAQNPRRLPLVFVGILGSGLALAAKTIRAGVRSRAVFGSSLKKNEVGTLIYRDFLPLALAEGRYQAAPKPLVVGHGLEFVQQAMDVQRAGVSAQKVVVTL